MTETVRVRYAPSPTGLPHVGNIRTALFNWLFARRYGGRFIVRIEDTDTARTVPGALEGILEGLEWLGLDWDEGPVVGGQYGPYFQSQRLEIYQRAAAELVEKGHAYYCHCSSERLAEMREAQTTNRQPPGYDRFCRDLGLGSGQGAVIRFRIPQEGNTTFRDLIRGEVSFENRLLDDFVLLKSDGFPTYHLANVIDDHMMDITHVMRAEEWLSSTPRHLMLYSALGYDPPEFAHLPIILGTDRSKLSKRHGAVSILDYKKQGYLPAAMMNFLALLGWSLDDRTEIFSREELFGCFSLEKISQTSAIFNREKLDWMNGIYIRQASLDDYVKYSLPFLERGLPSDVPRPLNIGYVKKVLELLQERTKLLSETALESISWFFFRKDIEYPRELLIDKKLGAAATAAMLNDALTKISPLPIFEAAPLEELLRPLAGQLGVKTGQLFGALRTAVTGLTATPPLFQTMAVLGREVCLARIEKAISKLKE